NSGPARTGTISIAGLTFIVNQAGPCASAFDSAGQNFSPGGGGGLLHVLAPPGCAWSIVNDNPGVIHIDSPSPPNGAGNATVVVSISSNPFQSPQTGALHLSG